MEGGNADLYSEEGGQGRSIYLDIEGATQGYVRMKGRKAGLSIRYGGGQRRVIRIKGRKAGLFI